MVDSTSVNVNEFPPEEIIDRANDLVQAWGGNGALAETHILAQRVMARYLIMQIYTGFDPIAFCTIFWRFGEVMFNMGRAEERAEGGSQKEDDLAPTVGFFEIIGSLIVLFGDWVRRKGGGK